MMEQIMDYRYGVQTVFVPQADLTSQASLESHVDGPAPTLLRDYQEMKKKDKNYEAGFETYQIPNKSKRKSDHLNEENEKKAEKIHRSDKARPNDQNPLNNEEYPRLTYSGRTTYINDEFLNQNPEIYPKYLVISPLDESEDITNVSIFKIFRDLKKSLTSDAESIRKQIQNKTILIKVKNEKDSNTLLNLKNLCNLPVKVTPHRALNTSKGVVKSADLKGCTKEEIIEEFRQNGVIDATNITINKNGKIIHTNTWILTFGVSEAPTIIQLPGCITLEVKKYIPKPMVCQRCGKLGHTIKRCKFSENSRCDHCREADHSYLQTNVETYEDGTTETFLDKIPEVCPYIKTSWCPNCKEPGHWPKGPKCEKYRKNSSNSKARCSLWRNLF